MNINEYILDLDVDFKGLTFKGKERIKFSADREKLSLNSAELDVESILHGKEQLRFSADEQSQTLDIQKEFSGDSEILITFSGKVSESLQGLYIARYSKNDYMLSTQFESTGARFLFPCLDHPAYKARFSLNLTINEELDAISNMPQSSVTQKDGGKKLITFLLTNIVLNHPQYAGTLSIGYLIKYLCNLIRIPDIGINRVGVDQ